MEGHRIDRGDPKRPWGGIHLNNYRKDYRTGSLPERYPLATSLTPMQESADPVYENSEALSRGTLFPGLDLPFMNVVNPDLPDTPHTEMMALDFVVHELGLYLPRPLPFSRRSWQWRKKRANGIWSCAGR